jgi:hypothetical protein
LFAGVFFDFEALIGVGFFTFLLAVFLGFGVAKTASASASKSISASRGMALC